MYKQTTRIALFILTLIVAVGSTAYATAFKQIELKDTEYFELENGLKVYIKRDTRMKNVSVTLGVRFGSAHDIKGKDGLAHYTFMLADRAIANAFESTYTAILEKSSTSYSPSFTRDGAFFTTVCDPRDLDTVLTLEAQRLAMESFERSEFDAVKRLKIAEFMKGTYEALSYKEKSVLYYPIFNFWEYSHNPEGMERDVRVARVQDMERFLAWYYSTDNASLVIRGPVNTREVNKRVSDIFKTLKPSFVKPLLTKSYTKKAVRKWGKFSNNNMKNPGIGISYTAPPRTNKDYPVIDVLFHLLFKGKKSLLGSYAAKSTAVLDYYTTLTESDGPNIMAVKFSLPAVAYWDVIKDKVTEELNVFNAEKFNTRLFTNARSSALTDLIEQFNSTNFTQSVSELLLLFGSPQKINSHLKIFFDMTVEQFLGTIKDYIDEKNRAIIYYQN